MNYSTNILLKALDFWIQKSNITYEVDKRIEILSLASRWCRRRYRELDEITGLKFDFDSIYTVICDEMEEDLYLKGGRNRMTPIYEVTDDDHEHFDDDCRRLEDFIQTAVQSLKESDISYVSEKPSFFCKERSLWGKSPVDHNLIVSSKFNDYMMRDE